MMEHSFFLEAAFMEKNKEYKKIASDFKRYFSEILEKTVNLSKGRVSNSLLESNEIVTGKTLEAEKKTMELSGINIDTNITILESNLMSGMEQIDRQLLNEVSNLNKKTLPLIQNLIEFKNRILNEVLACKIYTTNYPLLIKHIMDEAKMYYNLLNRVENKQPLSRNYIYEQELFWNNIMKEHAEFIRGLLDPSEKDLILTADKFANEYEAIIKNYSNNPAYLTNVSLKETLNFKNFKVSGEEGILNCKIKSIIFPLLADHVVREANHFIRILKSPNINM